MLSIIVPTLNEKDNIDKLITHLKRQMEEEDEIIVVDAYSTDGTRDIVNKHGAKLVLQKPMGIGLAKTEGAKHAKNDIFVFLDADCVPSGNFLHGMRDHFRNKEILAVGGLDLYESDSGIWKFLYDTFSRIVFYWAMLTHKVTGKYWIAANNSAYRRDVFFSVGGLRSVICEDVDMMRRLPASKNVIYDSKLVLTISDRRFRERGFFRTMGLWLWSDILIILGKGADTKEYRTG